MNTVRKLSTIVGISALLLAGCDNKASECNTLIKGVNDAQAKVKEPHQDDPAGLEKFAGALDTAAAEVNKAEVKLPELQKFRGDYASTLTAMAKTFREAAEAGKAGDAEKLEAAVKSFPEVGAKIDKATTDINAFCTGK
jgi:outer membrane murein-binding lipoprotein Lpp